MDKLILIRQMIAEQKFIEAKKQIEVELCIPSSPRYEYLCVYEDLLNSLEIHIPDKIIFELAELRIEKKEFKKAKQNLDLLKTEAFKVRKYKLLIQLNLERGKVQELFNSISELMIWLLEKNIPSYPQWLLDIVEKHFKNDYSLNLNIFALHLETKNIEEAEKKLKQLILSSFEKSISRGRNDLLGRITELLCHSHGKYQLEIYQSLCHLLLNDISQAGDYKKIIEMILYFDDFKFKTLILSILVRQNLSEEALIYSQEMKKSSDYDYLYINKYFPELKELFVRKETNLKENSTEEATVDLTLENHSNAGLQFEPITDEIEELNNIINLIKHQDYSADQLCELSVTFIQLHFPKTALAAATRAMSLATDDKMYLKGCYLKLTCYLMLLDYRAAIDAGYEGLAKSMTEDDLLSFLYGQAEGFIKLNQKQQAKKVLERIRSINADYRLTKEKLSRLNEV